jgi:hypothetical protein
LTDGDRVRWLAPERSADTACVLCGNPDRNRVFMEALHPDPARGYMEVARCAECGSAWFPEIHEMLVGYPDSLERIDDPDFWA